MSEAQEDVNAPEQTPAPTLEQQLAAAAKEQGWREDGALPAHEFLIRGSQFHRDLKKTTDELRAENAKVYKVVAEHISSQQKREFERDSAAHSERIRAAAEQGNADEVLRLNAAAPKPPEPVADPGMEFTESWVGKNAWFNDNEEMKDDALGFYQTERLKLGRDDPAVILPKVEARIRKIHASYFKPPENPNRQRAGGGELGGKLRGHKGDSLSVDDLDSDEKAHFDQLKALGLDEGKMLKSIENLRKQRGI